MDYAEDVFSLNFARPAAEGAAPHGRAIYCVYGLKDQELLLLYIGRAEMPFDRFEAHLNQGKLREIRQKGWSIIFTVADVGGYSSGQVDQIEAALVFKHQPLLNTRHKDSFDYPGTSVGIRGVTPLLNRRFTVGRRLPLRTAA